MISVSKAEGEPMELQYTAERFISAADEETNRSSRSMALQSQNNCLKANSLITRRAHLQARFEIELAALKSRPLSVTPDSFAQR
jgi:hypothetical protein